MRNRKKIVFNFEIINEIVHNILSLTPGVDMKKDIKVDFDQKSIPIVSITFSHQSDISNIYDLCIEIQDLVYYKLSKDFDLKQLFVNVIVV